MDAVRERTSKVPIITEGSQNGDLRFSEAKANPAIAATCVNLTKNLVGSGIFSLPSALQRGSVIPGVGIMCFVGAVQGGSFILIAALCQKLGTRTYRVQLVPMNHGWDATHGLQGLREIVLTGGRITIPLTLRARDRHDLVEFTEWDTFPESSHECVRTDLQHKSSLDKFLRQVASQESVLVSAVEVWRFNSDARAREQDLGVLAKNVLAVTV